MSTTAGGYKEPSVSDSDLIELNVLYLNGEGCRLKLGALALGREVQKMVSRQLPKRGAKPALHHLDSPLKLRQTLRQQGIVGESATLSCIYAPTGLSAAWKYAHGF